MVGFPKIYFTEEQEREYQKKRFQDSCGAVVCTCFVNTMLHALRAVAFPSRVMGCFVHVLGSLFFLWVRLHLRHVKDLNFASAVFSWTWCAGVICCNAGLATSNFFMQKHTLITTSGLLLIALSAFLLCTTWMAHWALQPRARNIGVLFGPSLPLVSALFYPTSFIGAPWETLLLLAAVLLGAASGCMLDAYSRQSFLLHAPVAAAAMHPVTLRLADHEQERAYRVRRFTASYSTVLVFLPITITLVGLLFLKRP